MTTKRLRRTVVYLDPREWLALQAAARGAGCSASEVVRRWIRNLNWKGKG